MPRNQRDFFNLGFGNPGNKLFDDSASNSSNESGSVSGSSSRSSRRKVRVVKGSLSDADGLFERKASNGTSSSSYDEISLSPSSSDDFDTDELNADDYYGFNKNAKRSHNEYHLKQDVHDKILGGDKSLLEASLLSSLHKPRELIRIPTSSQSSFSSTSSSYVASNSSSSSFLCSIAHSFKRYLRIRAVFIFVFIVVAYVCLNNYLVMFFYFKTSSQSSEAVQSSKSADSSVSIISSSSSFWSINALLYFFQTQHKKTAEKSPKTNFSDDYYYENPENEELASTSGINSVPEVLIDPEDLDVAGLDAFKFARYYRSQRLVILNDTYFAEDNLDLLSGEDHSSGRSSEENSSQLSFKPKKPRRPCVHPKLNPYNREIMQFVKKEPELKCNPKQNWIYVENGTLRVSKTAIRKHGAIVCAYIPLYRGGNDFSVYEGNRIFPVMDKMPLITDFFKIDCRSKDGAIYSNIHSGIAYESSLHMRHIWNPLPKKALGYNVLMFGFDSVSRMSWIRMLPKTYEYMIKEGFIVLKGYNIVGDGTPQALLPILTGKKETELPEARRGFVNATYVDNFPWIWKTYKKAGYVTQWAEDMQSIGTFQLRMLGFRKQPVDHYMRLFYLEAERYYTRFRRLCLGSISRHMNMFNWVKEFFTTYESKPKFSFIFHSEASHNYNNPLSLIDEDLRDFLKYLKHSGIMSNTILLFMSDHGVRVSDLRQYSQGKLEERLPFFSVRMPETFQKKYPEHMRNLRLNARKLTTPFDIHETLEDILSFDPSPPTPPKQERVGLLTPSMPPRGISLFRYISPNRSCEDARIEAHWCSCLNWIDVNILSQENKNNSKPDPSDAIQTTSDQYELDADPEIDNSTVNGEPPVEARVASVLGVISSNSSGNASSVETQSNVGTRLLVKKQLNYTEYREIRKNLRRFSHSALKVAQKAVNYMNTLIDEELKYDCERIRLQSIEKISKLDLNRKLLAFKESKDIHGREAVFDEMSLVSGRVNNNNNTGNLTISKMVANRVFDELENDLRVAEAAHYDQTTTTTTTISTPASSTESIQNETKPSGEANDDLPVNLLLPNNQTATPAVEMSSSDASNTTKNTPTIQNTDIVFQIVLTTWPGNASYELSLKYNKYSGHFQFNKNEISRINNYNTTSNCMLDKRPDLRQFCYCRYQ